MARVLVLEDEDCYREVLARYLAHRGHEVWDTAQGNEAIALGLAHGPDVLVADWMLRNSVHGLHVAEALRVADPGLHTVVVTGFPDSDLTIDRERVGIVALLEKPFDVEALGAAVARAAEAPDAKHEEVIGALLVEEGGNVVRHNGTARGLLAETRAGAASRTLDAGFGAGTLERLRTKPESWSRVSPGGDGGLSFWLRARSLGGGAPTLVLICRAGQEWRREDPRVRLLLGLPLSRSEGWSFREGMLLVDDSDSVRDTFVTQLASRGCPARAAGSHGQAVDLLREEPELRVVILDWAMPGEDLRSTVARMREIRPEVLLVGTSGEDRREEFAELGIENFLLKPWTVAGDLTALLAPESRSQVS